MKIKQAAIKDATDTVWTLPRPARHNHIVSAMYHVRRHAQLSTDEQGFITEDNVFVDRKTAAKIAIKCGQATATELFTEPYEKLLYSEDLW